MKSWFQKHSEIQFIDWPGNSPDLNPIENAWNWMKLQLKEKVITNLEQLEQEIKELWCIKMADGEYLHTLVNSIPRRLATVKEMMGDMTKY